MVLLNTGFCIVDEKLSGPVHEKLTPDVEVVHVNFSVSASQTELLYDNAKFSGIDFTKTLTVSGFEMQYLFFALKMY